MGVGSASGLSLLLFIILVLETLSYKFRIIVPWELLYAVDLMLIMEIQE